MKGESIARVRRQQQIARDNRITEATLGAERRQFEWRMNVYRQQRELSLGQFVSVDIPKSTRWKFWQTMQKAHNRG